MLTLSVFGSGTFLMHITIDPNWFSSQNLPCFVGFSPASRQMIKTHLFLAAAMAPKAVPFVATPLKHLLWCLSTSNAQLLCGERRWSGVR